MSRETWSAIKNSKRFYVNLYRRMGTLLAISVVLSFVLELAIYYVYLSWPDPDFYATSGETPPAQLAPMDSPNYTSDPLLGNDPVTANDLRVIPK